jgi:hypothetical protein
VLAKQLPDAQELVVFASRSELSEPEFVATAMSAMVASSVSLSRRIGHPMFIIISSRTEIVFCA